MRTCGSARTALRSAHGTEPVRRCRDPDRGGAREPAPRGAARRVGPAVLALTAALALTGSLAAGASALTSTAQAPTRAVEKSGHVAKQGHRRGTHGLCHKGDRPGLPPPSATSSYGFVVDNVKVSVRA